MWAFPAVLTTDTEADLLLYLWWSQLTAQEMGAGDLFGGHSFMLSYAGLCMIVLQ